MGGHILLVGMMGSGKSTVGRLAAQRLGVDWIDTDEEVVRANGSSISELFASVGEEGFRSEEARAVLKAVSRTSPAVVSVGGGAVLQPSSRALIHGAGLVVWLRASMQTLAERLGDSAGRPLLDATDVPGSLARLDQERCVVYGEVAHATVETDGLSSAEVADRVVELRLELSGAGAMDEGVRP